MNLQQLEDTAPRKLRSRTPLYVEKMKVRHGNIIDMYKRGYALKKIKEKLNVSHRWVYIILQRNSVPIRDPLRAYCRMGKYKRDELLVKGTGL